MGKTNYNIEKITLSSDQEQELVNKLKTMVEDAEEYKSNYDEWHRDNMRMFLAVPDQEVKEFPWDRASNLFIPLVRVVMEGLLSQIHDAMLATKPRAIGFEGGDVQNAKLLSQFYFDYLWQQVLNLAEVGNDWLFHTLLDGTGVVKARWGRDLSVQRSVETVRKPIVEKVPTGIDDDVEGVIPIDFDLEINEVVSAQHKERPYIDPVNGARLFVAPGTKTGLQYPDCHWYFEETLLTWPELLQRRAQGYEGIDDELFASLKEQQVTPQEEEARTFEELSNKDPRKARVLTFFMRLVLPGEIVMPDGETKTQSFMSEAGVEEEVVITMLADVDRIARVVPLARISPNNERPHFDNRYKRLPGQFYALGVPSSMRHLQRMTNSLFNQSVDAGTLQNLPFFFYQPENTGLIPEVGMIRPGAFIPVDDVSSIQERVLVGDRQFYPQAMNMVQQWVERDSSVTDFVLGRNPQNPTAPRTLGQQTQFLQQSNLAFSRLVALMAQPFIKLLRYTHYLYQKHAPEGVEFRAFQ